MKKRLEEFTVTTLEDDDGLPFLSGPIRCPPIHSPLILSAPVQSLPVFNAASLGLSLAKRCA
jgi:hypothetical protein